MLASPPIPSAAVQVVYNLDIGNQWAIDERPRLGGRGKSLPLVATPQLPQCRPTFVASFRWRRHRQATAPFERFPDYPHNRR
jgi:hypothetical protein